VGSGTATTPVRREAGAPATLSFRVDYGFGPQEISINLGHFQQPDGLTQFDGTAITTSSVQQNGSPRGNFKDVEISEGGYVVVNYDNGVSRQVGRIPVIMFNNPNALHRESGGVYTETLESGDALAKYANIEGAGQIIVNSLENSNVDIADEFTKLIVTQRTYSANTKIVTTSDEMLQEIIGLKR
jgi:flagellar hook protein FlgE